MANFCKVFLVFFKQPKNSGRKQTTSMISLINKKIRPNEVSLPKHHTQVSNPPLSDLLRKMKLMSRKLDEGNLKGWKRLATADEKIAPFSYNNYQKELSKRTKRA